MKPSTIVSVTIIAVALLLNMALTFVAMNKTSRLESAVRGIQAVDQTAITAALAKVEPTLRKHETELNNLSTRHQQFADTLTTTVVADMKKCQDLLDKQNSELLDMLKDQGKRISTLEIKVDEIYAMVQRK